MPTTIVKRELTTPETVVAGAGAGLVELVTEGGKSLGVFGSLKSIVAEGGVARLYRGILAPAFQEPIKRSVKFTGNALYSKLLPYDNVEARFASGWLAGMTECLSIAPFEVVKIRMQASNRINAYKSVPHCAQTILATEGPMGFLQGIEAAVWRSASWSGCYFASIWWLKRNTLRIENENSAPKSNVMLRNFTCGLVGGTLGTIVNNPFDVVTSRMRNVLPGEFSPYRWALPSLVQIMREEGVAALYKGFLPKVMRLGPGGGIMIMCFDVAKAFLVG